jgi:hypothetical protein
MDPQQHQQQPPLPQPPPPPPPPPLVAAHQGLAPPGAPVDSRCPLVDWVLPDAGGLAGALLSFLTPLDVRGLRAACRAGRAAVAAHRWDAALDVVCRDPFDAASASARLVNDEEYLRRPWGAVNNGLALRRWLACHPCARTLVLSSWLNNLHSPTMDADVAALLAGSAVTRLHVVLCNELTAAGLQPVLPQLTELALLYCASLDGSAWAGATPRLQRLIACGCADVFDNHLAPLTGAMHVALLAPSVHVTGAGVAAHLARTITRLELSIDAPGFDGTGLAACTRMEALTLLAYDDIGFIVPVTGGPLAAGSTHRLAFLQLQYAALPDAWLAGLRALTRAHLDWVEGLTDAAWDGTPALTHLWLIDSRGLAGARLPPQLAVLEVDSCPHFAGTGLAGCPHVEELAVKDCAAFDPGASALAALPRLRQLRVTGSPLLTDDAVAAAPALVDLELSRCHGVEGEGLAPLARSLRVLRLEECEGFTGGSLPCLGELMVLDVASCPSLKRRALVAAARTCPRLAHICCADSGEDDDDDDSSDTDSVDDSSSGSETGDNHEEDDADDQWPAEAVAAQLRQKWHVRIHGRDAWDAARVHAAVDTGDGGSSGGSGGGGGGGGADDGGADRAHKRARLGEYR